MTPSKTNTKKNKKVDDKPTDPLLPHSPDLKNKLDEIKKKCLNEMAQIRAIGGFKYYIGHDIEHLNLVWKYAGNLIEGVEFFTKPFIDERFPLNDEEKFILGCSCFAHDLGMLQIIEKHDKKLITEEIRESEKIRKEHAKHAQDIFEAKIQNQISCEGFESLFKWIGKISRAHSGYDIGENFKMVLMKLDIRNDYPHIKDEDMCVLMNYTIDYNNKKHRIRPALLSAILRLSDALCYSKYDTLNNMDIIIQSTKKLSDSMMKNDTKHPNFVYEASYDDLEKDSILFCLNKKNKEDDIIKDNIRLLEALEKNFEVKGDKICISSDDGAYKILKVENSDGKKIATLTINENEEKANLDIDGEIHKLNAKKFDSNPTLKNFYKIYTNLGSFRNKEIIPFLYKQILEYWKHGITHSVSVEINKFKAKVSSQDPTDISDSSLYNFRLWDDDTNHTIKIVLKLFNKEKYPNFYSIKNMEEFEITDVVREKFNEEIGSVRTIFKSYGININCDQCESSNYVKSEKSNDIRKSIWYY